MQLLSPRLKMGCGGGGGGAARTVPKKAVSEASQLFGPPTNSSSFFFSPLATHLYAFRVRPILGTETEML